MPTCSKPSASLFFSLRYPILTMPDEITYRGTNDQVSVRCPTGPFKLLSNMQGNQYDVRENTDTGSSGYHYSKCAQHPVPADLSSDGSYYYQNTDSSTYYNSGDGYARYTSSGGGTTEYYGKGAK